MLKSMTGFGRGEAEACGRKFTVELKSVNHRFSEVVVRMPRTLSSLEDRIRRAIQQHIGRGRVDCFISVEETEQKQQQVKVDKELALAYHSAMKEVQHLTGAVGNIELRDIINQPNVLTLEEPEEDLEAWWSGIEQALKAALESLIQMRVVEGTKLGEDIEKRLGIIKEYNHKIYERAPLVVVEHRERLTQRLAEWQNNGAIDESRIAAEVAIFADRCSITEEIVRLNSHLDQMHKSLQAEEPVGRKLDFIVQEMNREINTIGSKANDLEIGNSVINVKSEIEKIREQVQNIE